MAAHMATECVCFDQEDMNRYLDTVLESNEQGPKLVKAYTYLTFPLSARFTNLVTLPRPRGNVYGVQANFVDVRIHSPHAQQG